MIGRAVNGLGAGLLCGLLLTGSAARAEVDHLLPLDYQVYVFDGGVVNHPGAGTHAVTLPTVNLYHGPQGGYVACYSHQKRGSAYSVGGEIYVMGQVRLRGDYDGRIFQPRGYRGADVSALPRFKRICRRSLWSCRHGGCWAGGDTGGWFGIA